MGLFHTAHESESNLKENKFHFFPADVLDQSLETFLSIKFDRDEDKTEGNPKPRRRKLRARTSSLDNKNSSTRVSRERWKKALMPPPSAPLKKSR